MTKKKEGSTRKWDLRLSWREECLISVLIIRLYYIYNPKSFNDMCSFSKLSVDLFDMSCYDFKTLDWANYACTSFSLTCKSPLLY